MEDITQRAHEALQRIGQVLKIKPNGQEWDDLCVAAVLSVTKLSREWLAVAVNQTAAAVRSRRHSDRPITDPVRYLKGCLRNGLAETLGLCGTDDVFGAYGQLYRWSRPLVGRLKQYAEAERSRPQCPK